LGGNSKGACGEKRLVHILHTGKHKNLVMWTVLKMVNTMQQKIGKQTSTSTSAPITLMLIFLH